MGRSRQLLASLALMSACGLSTAAGLVQAAPAAAQSGAAASTLRLTTAPLNPAFVQYRARRAAAQAHAAQAVRRLGLVPSPIDFAYLEATKAVPRVAGSPYPASYDLRDPAINKQSPIEDQGIYGSCWAFASLGSLESSLLPGDPQVYSEDNLILNCGFDGGSSGLYDNGGDDLMATAYLARWAGPVDAASDAYGDGHTPPGLSALRHVQDVVFLPPRSNSLDNDTLKWAITTYGGVYTDIFADGGMINSTSSAYFNYAIGTDGKHISAYCYTGSAYVNHAVDIVGWDDAYPAANFATAANGGTPAPGDGAFIVRNSWGTGWGDDGYFYVSYYDTSIGYGESSPMAAFDNADPTSNYSRIYQYDPLGWTGQAALGESIGPNSDVAWFANRFMAWATGQLTAVSFYAASPNAAYEIYTGSEPATATQLAGSGAFAMPGYHAVILDTPAPVTVGQDFTVAVKLTTPGNNYPIPLEEKIAGYSSGATSSPGESFVSPDGTTWTDITSLGTTYQTANVCLKAFAQTTNLSDVTPPVTTVAGADILWHNTARTLTFTANDEPGGAGVGFTQYQIDTGSWQMGTGVTVAAPASHANDGPHTILYRSVDAAGNTEAANSCVVSIDTRRPTPATPHPVWAVHGRAAALPFQINDVRPGSINATATVKIRTLSGKVLKTIVLTKQLMNRMLSCRFTCSLPVGTYRFIVYVTDAAGNVQTAPAANLLHVR
jgi:C1A family cysteine protease